MFQKAHVGGFNPNIKNHTLAILTLSGMVSFLCLAILVPSVIFFLWIGSYFFELVPVFSNCL